MTITDRTRPTATGLVLAGVTAAVALAMWRRRQGAAPSVLGAAGVRRLYDRVAPLYDAATSVDEAVGAYRFADAAIASLRLNRPFGVSEAYRDQRPWEAVSAATIDNRYEEMLGAAIYLATGTARHAAR